MSRPSNRPKVGERSGGRSEKAGHAPEHTTLHAPCHRADGGPASQWQMCDNAVIMKPNPGPTESNSRLSSPAKKPRSPRISSD